ncbi:testis-expressed protein 45-like [Pecten maximus]|uniref:testis-expressed protein 45-like n=1 Tax=Pecten maximus TaxID=6579 RepID=UPI001458484C|nr:testis-expressed protein 45-like [Pecten maximus]
MVIVHKGEQPHIIMAAITNPIYTPKTGTDFLSSTNFQVAQDMSVTPGSMQSVFKKDYPSYKHYGRDAEAERPALAEVMHRDGTYFREKASETTKSFSYKYMPKMVVPDVHRKLRSTNFKMDSDLSKVKSFQTMHDSYFTPKMDGDYERVQPVTALWAVNIPQGDREKADEPWSDYRDRYRGHDTSVHKVEKVPSMHEGGPPTVKGDARYTHFDTTHNSTFMGEFQTPIKSLPAPTGTNVPSGDPDKETVRETTMQYSFPNKAEASDYKPYMKDEVSKMLGKTNFKQVDGHCKYNDYQSTATVSYLPVTTPYQRYRPDRHRNHSDLPEGDHDEMRGGERVNLTTSRYYHGNPPSGLHNTIISGANLRTKSNVWFGEPRMSNTFYDTTTDDNFHPVTVPYTYNRAKFYKDSDIPLNYYDKSEAKHTSSWTDYKNPRRGKTVPNPVAINNLRKSHILPPLSGPQKHSTTHQVTFTPKDAELYSYDAGRLQKSSVPLGTMSA